MLYMQQQCSGIAAVLYIYIQQLGMLARVIWGLLNYYAFSSDDH